MKRTQAVNLPVLKDVVVPGKKLPLTDELPPVLSELQIKALQQQIETIIQTQLEITLKKISQDTINKINTHLDKVLPKLLQEMSQTVSNQKNEADEE